MKFLEDEKLAQLTADLTDAVLLGGSGADGDAAHHAVGPTSRVINGRIEAYTMKRVSSDKKYAHALGEKYVKEIEVVEEEMAKLQKSLGLEPGSGDGSGRRRRAGSVDDWKTHGSTKSSSKQSAAEAASGSGGSTSPKMTGKSGPGGSRAGRKPDKPPKGSTGTRRRSKSVDIGGVAKATSAASAGRVTFHAEPASSEGGGAAAAAAAAGASSSSGTSRGRTQQQQQPTSIYRGGSSGSRHRSSSFDSSSRRTYGDFGGVGGGSIDPSSSASAAALHSHGYFSNSSLGDFHEMGTRRLMTDLILTLNASFPDYDFSSVRPDHFIKMSTPSVAVNRVNERLSEFAATLPSNTHGYGADGYSYSYGYGVSQRDNGNVFLQKLWGAIDDVIVLNDCDVYSYVPPAGDNDDDPMGFLTETLTGYDEADNARRLGRPSVAAAGGVAAANGTTAVASSDMVTEPMLGAGGDATSLALTATQQQQEQRPVQEYSPAIAGTSSGEGASGAGGGGTTAVTASMPLWTFNYFFVNKSLKRIVLFACVQTMRSEVEMDVDADMDDVDDIIPAASRPTADGNGVMMTSSSADAAGTPSRYGDDEADDAESPPTGIARGGGGGARRQLLGSSMSTGGLASESVSGYYSISSTDARTDDEFDQFDTGNLAEDVSRPPTPATPVMG